MEDVRDAAIKHGLVSLRDLQNQFSEEKSDEIILHMQVLTERGVFKQRGIFRWEYVPPRQTAPKTRPRSEPEVVATARRMSAPVAASKRVRTPHKATQELIDQIANIVGLDKINETTKHVVVQGPNGRVTISKTPGTSGPLPKTKALLRRAGIPIT